MVRYYGYYSTVSRGKRKKQDKDDPILSILEPDGSPEEYRNNWARLIQKIYEVDPLICVKFGRRMKTLSFLVVCLLLFDLAIRLCCHWHWEAR